MWRMAGRSGPYRKKREGGGSAVSSLREKRGRRIRVMKKGRGVNPATKEKGRRGSTPGGHDSRGGRLPVGGERKSGWGGRADPHPPGGDEAKQGQQRTDSEEGETSPSSLAGGEGYTR